MKKRVADIVFETLVSNNIVDCFCVVGGGAMHLNNALAINPNINKYFNHHEQACSMAAEAYARYSGKMAAVCVTSGPGATNTLTGVMGAWEDSIPMIIISGNVRYETSVEASGLPLRYRGLQEFDIINSIKNMTKYSTVIKSPTSIKSEIKKAINVAMSGRRGPVWIDIPLDIQNTLVDENDLVEENYFEEENLFNQKIYEKIQRLARTAKRPCILMGSGIACAHLQEEFESFVEKVKIPVVGGAWLGDAFYSEHPYYYRMSGNAGPRVGNFIIQNSDLLLVLGNSLSYKQTGYNVASFAPKASIIMVDIDQNEFLKHKNKVDVFMNVDLKDFFLHAEKEPLCFTPREGWFKYCDKVKERFSPFKEVQNIKSENRVNKYWFWENFLEYMPDDTLLALGNSSVAMGANQIGRRYKNQRMISNYICGSMGYDLPAAIGVAVASNQRVICVTGDGSIMMNLQELQTIQHNKFQISIVVFENQGYGAIKQTCKNFFEGVEIGCSPQSGVACPDFSKIADAFNFGYRCCYSNSQVKESIDWLQNSNKNVILEIKQELDDPVLPKLMSRLTADGKMTEPELQNMYPFVSDEDMKWLILDEEN